MQHLAQYKPSGIGKDLDGDLVGRDNNDSDVVVLAVVLVVVVVQKVGQRNRSPASPCQEISWRAKLGEARLGGQQFRLSRGSCLRAITQLRVLRYKTAIPSTSFKYRIRVEEARDKHKERWGYKGRAEGPRRREDRRVNERGVKKGGVYRARRGGEGRVSISLAFWGWMVRCCTIVCLVVLLHRKKMLPGSGIPKSLITPSIFFSATKYR